MQALVVTFTDLELRALWEISNERSEVKIRAGVVDEIGIVENTSSEYVYIGLKGEYAVCKFLESPFDMENFVGKDLGFDTTMKNDKTVQIKTQQSGLFWLLDDNVNADLLVKVAPSEGSNDPYLKSGPHKSRDVKILGWLSTQEFVSMSEANTIGNLQVIAVSDKVLRPIWGLATYGQQG